MTYPDPAAQRPAADLTDGLIIPFTHRQSAHCETGVLANLLTHHGLEISEAMVFGIGSGLFFGYFPFLRLNGLPLTAYRIATGGIMKRVTRRLGIRLEWEKFRSPEKAMAALDSRLAAGIPMGCRTGAYWLSYFPPRYRFHFNMHNLVAYGKQNGSYLVSDPVFPEPVVCPAADLKKARFAKGPMPPKGRMYHVAQVPDTVDLADAARQGIVEVCRTMRGVPGPFIGTRAMRFLAGRLERWPEKLGQRRTALHIGQIIRMQEEIGTGGAGFRFIYAAFLQEAAALLDIPALQPLSEEMTAIGDRWREFALAGSRFCKKRKEADDAYPLLPDILRECADREDALLAELADLVRHPPVRGRVSR